MTLTAESIKPESIKPIHGIAIGLIVITGIIHLYAGVVEGRIPVSLAGVGFLAGVGLFLFDYRGRLLYLIGIAYTGIQIPLWYVAKVGEFTLLGYVDRVVQIVIIALLAYLYWTNE